MKQIVTITFSTDGDAFESGLYDAAMVVSDVAHFIRHDRVRGNVVDPNGNTIGEWSIAGVKETAR